MKRQSQVLIVVLVLLILLVMTKNSKEDEPATGSPAAFTKKERFRNKTECSKACKKFSDFTMMNDDDEEVPKYITVNECKEACEDYDYPSYNRYDYYNERVRNHNLAPYKQVGYLKNIDPSTVNTDFYILPIYGKPMDSRSWNSWHYYVQSPFGLWKLRIDNKDCYRGPSQSRYVSSGCRQLVNGETINLGSLGDYTVDQLELTWP